jgi:hypothetical protein
MIVETIHILLLYTDSDPDPDPDLDLDPDSYTVWSGAQHNFGQLVRAVSCWQLL